MTQLQLPTEPRPLARMTGPKAWDGSWHAEPKPWQAAETRCGLQLNEQMGHPVTLRRAWVSCPDCLSHPS